jgi:hypothetical protein
MTNTNIYGLLEIVLAGRDFWIRSFVFLINSNPVSIRKRRGESFSMKNSQNWATKERKA